MACCGRARSNAVNTGGDLVSARANGTASPSTSFVFEYVGETGMTIVGAGTGRTYRFPEPGSRQQVDQRDVRSFSAVPRVIKVK